MTGPIRCTRVDAPAKPSREEVIHRSILQWHSPAVGEPVGH